MAGAPVGAVRSAGVPHASCLPDELSRPARSRTGASRTTSARRGSTKPLCLGIAVRRPLERGGKSGDSAKEIQSGYACRCVGSRVGTPRRSSGRTILGPSRVQRGCGGVTVGWVAAVEVRASRESVDPAGSIAAYTCPMHPDVRTASEGTCPRCGMKWCVVPAGWRIGSCSTSPPTPRGPSHLDQSD